MHPDTLTSTRHVPWARSGFASLREVLADPERQAAVADVATQIRAQGIEYLYLQFVSIDGKVNGKGIPAREWLEVSQSGVSFHMAAVTDLRMDRQGRYLVFPAEAGEFTALPDPATFRALAWDARVARVFCLLFDQSGRPLDVDVRGNLLRLETWLREQHGYAFQAGIEPEMMILRRGEDGRPEGATGPYGYHLRQLDALRPVVLDMVGAAREMGLVMIQGDHEDAPGQLELNIRHANPVATADHHITFRQIAAAVAARHGYIASFMPKPFVGVSANGHHHHITLTDARTGADLFRDPSGSGLSATGLHFIGGLLRHADGLTVVAAPTVNSYKRFWDTGFWAPIRKRWGRQNRTALVRVTGTDRIEFRLPDSACNPYLTLAAVLLAGAAGVAEQADPGPPCDDNLYGLETADRIPLTLGEALQACRRDPLLHQALPGRLLDAILALRTDEWERYCATVSPWELERYLEMFP